MAACDNNASIPDTRPTCYVIRNDPPGATLGVDGDSAVGVDSGKMDSRMFGIWMLIGVLGGHRHEQHPVVYTE